MTADVLYIYKKDSQFKVLSHSACIDIVKQHKDLLENGFEHVSTINGQIFIEHRLNTGEITTFDILPKTNY